MENGAKVEALYVRDRGQLRRTFPTSSLKYIFVQSQMYLDLLKGIGSHNVVLKLF